jgi:hypothetical protein
MFMTDCSPESACPETFVNPWHVDVTGGVANVRVSAVGHPHAFQAAGFNLAGSSDGLAIHLHTPGYSFGGNDEPIGPFGGFEYIFDGPLFAPGAPPPDLEFTMSRTGGFTSALELFAPNALGYYVATNGFNFDAPGRYFVASDSIGTQAAPVPEPASVLLLGSGLALAWRSRRRRP